MQGYLSKLPGVKSARVNFDKKTAEVTYDPAQTDPEKLGQGLSEASGGRYSMQVRR